jgi:hypothetical protein
MSPKRLVIMVEGEGDKEAALIPVKRLLVEHGGFDVVFLDPHPIKIGHYAEVCKKENGKPFGKWHRLLQTCWKRANLGGVLLLLDGDSDCIWDAGEPVKGEAFCAMRAAKILAQEARKVGAGSRFSVAVVFACQEFESWFIAVVNSFVGKHFLDNRITLPQPITTIPPNPEIAPRDAKAWVGKYICPNYNPSVHQKELAQLVDLNLIREKMRSFRRLEKAVKELVHGIRTGQPICTP